MAAHIIAPGKPVEVEVVSLDELKQARAAGTDIIMLDELSLDNQNTVATITAPRTKLEASGGINNSTLHATAETGVDYTALSTPTNDVQ